MRRKTFISALFALSGLCLACSEKNSGKTGTVTDVIIDKQEVMVREGASLQLNAVVMPEDAADKGVTWSSDNPDAAIVDILSGLVTGISEGTAIVTAVTDVGGYSAQCTVTVRPPVSVYAVGNTMTSAVLWVDGESSELSTALGSTATSICLHGDDVYVGGQEWQDSGWTGCIWKNGQAMLLDYREGGSESVADITVDSVGNVYACGYAVTSDPRAVVPVLWTNGTASLLPVESTYAEGGVVAIRGNDVYVAGYDFNTAYDFGLYTYGVLWTNGQRSVFTDGLDYIECTDAVVTGGKLYIVGTRTDPSGMASAPFVYSDGVITELGGVSNASATSVCVDGDDIYVAGYTDVSIRDANGDKIPRYIPVLWKNGAPQLFTDGTTFSQAYVVAVRDGDVYVGGCDSELSDTPYTRTYAVIWKNGERIFTDNSGGNTCISDMALTE